jgi:hypothetical protein
VLCVDLVGSRRIWPAQVGWVVDLVGSRRVLSDRLDDQTDDQAAWRSGVGIYLEGPLVNELHSLGFGPGSIPAFRPVRTRVGKRLPETGAFKFGSHEVRSMKLCSMESGGSEIGHMEHRASKVHAVEARQLELGLYEPRILEVSVSGPCLPQSAACEIGMLKVSVAEA